MSKYLIATVSVKDFNFLLRISYNNHLIIFVISQFKLLDKEYVTGFFINCTYVKLLHNLPVNAERKQLLIFAFPFRLLSVAANCKANVTANMNDVTKPKISKVRTAVNQAEIKRYSDKQNFKGNCNICSMYNRYFMKFKKGVLILTKHT